MHVWIFGSNEVIKNTDRHNRLTYSLFLFHTHAHTHTHSCISWPRVWAQPEQGGLFGPCSSYDERGELRRSLHPTHTDRLQAWLKLLFPPLAAKMPHASLPTLSLLKGEAAYETNNWGEMLKLAQCRSQEYNQNGSRPPPRFWVSRSKATSKTSPHTWQLCQLFIWTCWDSGQQTGR